MRKAGTEVLHASLARLEAPAIVSGDCRSNPFPILVAPRTRGPSRNTGRSA